MLTLIELFDREMTENAISPLLFHPEKVIYLGYRGQLLPGHRRDLSRFLKDAGLSCQTEFVTVDRYDKDGISQAILTILQKNPGCAFDITGGGELALVVMGELSQHLHIPMHQVEVETGRVIAVSGEAPVPGVLPKLTAAQQIQLYGGRILSSEDSGWADTADFREAVIQLWRYCRKDPDTMNRHGSFFGCAESTGGLTARWVRRAGQREPEERFLHALRNDGLLSQLSIREQEITLTYRDRNIRRLFAKAGNLLEVYVWLAAREAGVFQDAKQGVVLDWDGDSDTPSETKNEVDVLVMRGMIPGFLSCKNGSVKKDALYELETVAERFGGRYAKKLLAVTAMDRNPSSAAYLRTRAADSGIQLIEDVHKMELGALSDAICRVFE